MAYNSLLVLHVIAGAISLILFWLPIITVKGKVAHRRIGIVYSYAMGLVVTSALVLSIMQIVNGSMVEGWLLLFLAVLTANPLISGVAILRSKKPSIGYQRLRQVLTISVLAVSIVLIVGWQMYDNGVMLGFGLVGILGSLGDVSWFRSMDGQGKSWLRQHYEAMLFSGAAAYTAFLVFGGRTLLADIVTGWWTTVPWVLPTLLTAALMPLVHRRFKQQKKVVVRAG